MASIHFLLNPHSALDKCGIRGQLFLTFAEKATWKVTIIKKTILVINISVSVDYMDQKVSFTRLYFLPPLYKYAFFMYHFYKISTRIQMFDGDVIQLAIVDIL